MATSFVSWHEGAGCFRKRIGKAWNRDRTALVPKAWYFHDAGKDAAKATALAVQKREEWRELVQNWSTISPSLRLRFPNVSEPFWPEEQQQEEVEADVVSTGVVDDTIETALTMYTKEQQAKLGRKGNRGRKPSTIKELLAAVKRCLNGLNHSASVKTLTLPVLTKMVDGWYGGDLSERTALNNARVLKQFLNWLADSEHFDFTMPKGVRNLFRLGTPESDTYVPTDDEIKTILTNAKGSRAEVWVLLALNAGMYQSDCSSFLKSEWRGDLAAWKRDKQSATNKFTIYTHLWPETIKAIKKWANGKSERVFETVLGTPLEERFQRVDGAIVRTHNISDDFNAVLKQCKNISSKLSFKSLRKWTANQLYRQNGNNLKLSDMFLGRKIPGVTGASYVVEFYDPMNDGLTKLHGWMTAQKYF